MTMRRTTNHEPMSDKITKYRGDYIGMKFGKLTVIAYPADENGVRMGGCFCRCDCGAEIEALHMGHLLNGSLKDCPSCRRARISEQARESSKKRLGRYSKDDYEFIHERLFRVWKGMLSRCENEGTRSYRDYGAKGVSICPEWHDYRIFREWALATGYDENAPRSECTIDRINPFGNYEPSNCRWANSIVQQNNRRTNWFNLDLDGRRAALATAGTYVRG